LRKKQISSYSDLGNAALGTAGGQFVDFCMVFAQLGFAIAYLLFFGAQLDQVVCMETGFCEYKVFYISCAAFILIPVCWLRSFKMLAYVSMAANCFLFFACKNHIIHYFMKKFN